MAYKPYTNKSKSEASNSGKVLTPTVDTSDVVVVVVLLDEPKPTGVVVCDPVVVPNQLLLVFVLLEPVSVLPPLSVDGAANLANSTEG